MPADFPYRKIVVIGTTGSGKSTTAAKLADILGLDFIDLDALHWEPNWVDAPVDVFRARVEAATRSPGWALAGNYSKTRDLVWSRSEAVVWLDYPFWTVFWQLTRRSFARWWNKELLWGTNYESLWTHFKLWSEDSLWHWLVKTYWRRKREYPMLLARPENAHLHLIHMKTPQETRAWLDSLLTNRCE
jgi:adenylate kinase family enzyme